MLAVAAAVTALGAALANLHMHTLAAIPGHGVQQAPEEPGAVLGGQVFVAQRMQWLQQQQTLARRAGAPQVEQRPQHLIGREGPADHDPLQHGVGVSPQPPGLQRHAVHVKKAAAVEKGYCCVVVAPSSRDGVPPPPLPLRKGEGVAISGKLRVFQAPLGGHLTPSALSGSLPSPCKGEGNFFP